MNGIKVSITIITLFYLYVPIYSSFLPSLSRARLVQQRPVQRSSLFPSKKPTFKFQKGTPVEQSPKTSMSSMWRNVIAQGKQATQSLKDLGQKLRSYLLTKFNPEEYAKERAAERKQLVQKINYLIKEIFNNPQRKQELFIAHTP